MNHTNWACPNCSNIEYETDQIATTSGVFNKLFDIQNKTFSSVTCTSCRYTEIYKSESSQLGNLFDFFTN